MHREPPHTKHAISETGTFLVKRHNKEFPVSATIIARASHSGKQIQIAYQDEHNIMHRRWLRSDEELARFTSDTSRD